MEIVQIILVFAVFLILAGLMFLRKIPALIALPIMAFLIPIIAGVSLIDTLELVLGNGSLRLAEAYTIAIFGSMLSIMLQKTGVAESFIKLGAELSGDKPWAIAVVMLILIALLFTTLGGLGAIIMVSTVVLPILISVGAGPVTTTGIFLIGLSMGGILNVGNWSVYINTLNLESGEVRLFALVMFGITFLVSLIFITVQLFRDGHEIDFKGIAIKGAVIIFAALLLFTGYFYLDQTIKDIILTGLSNTYSFLKYVILTVFTLLIFLSIYKLIILKPADSNKIFFPAYFTPLVPLLLILVFNMNFIAAFIAGLIYGFITTYRKSSMNILVRSALDGGAVVMPAVVLMLGIGMLLNAVMGPPAAIKHAYTDGWPVLTLLKPVIEGIVPSNALAYIFTFTLAAPLALYRGPLNVWGMGYGIAAILLASGMIPGAIMGMLMSVGQIQGVSDPTNTQNVWLANEMRIDVQKILWTTLPYTWLIAVLGLVAASLIFY
ncbi:MAG: citrate transporter [Ignavibacteriaceae bacterium]|nr:citrate transporter [Ignavibacteriaceae bacterium]